MSYIYGAPIFVCCECRVLSGRGLCDELITRPEESYRLCCVVVCDLETSRMGPPCIYDISHLRVNSAVMYGIVYLYVCFRRQCKVISKSVYFVLARDIQHITYTWNHQHLTNYNAFYVELPSSGIYGFSNVHSGCNTSAHCHFYQKISWPE